MGLINYIKTEKRKSKVYQRQTQGLEVLLDDTNALKQHGLGTGDFVENIEYSRVCESCPYGTGEKEITLKLKGSYSEKKVKRKLKKAKAEAKNAKCMIMKPIIKEELENTAKYAHLNQNKTVKTAYFGNGDKAIGKFYVNSGATEGLKEDMEQAQYCKCNMIFETKSQFGDERKEYLQGGKFKIYESPEEMSQKEFRNNEPIDVLKRPRRVRKPILNLAHSLRSKLREVRLGNETVEKVKTVLSDVIGGTSRGSNSGHRSMASRINDGPRSRIGDISKAPTNDEL